MAIAVDQTRLRNVVHMLLKRDTLDRGETTTILHIAQLAAGADLDDEPTERSVLHSVAQHLCARVGLEARSIEPVMPIFENAATVAWMRTLARELHSRGARELAYGLALLISLADLQLAAREIEWLEALQRELRIDDRRATDIVICVTNAVASDGVPASPAS